jgi:hypothetical protein
MHVEIKNSSHKTNFIKYFSEETHFYKIYAKSSEKLFPENPPKIKIFRKTAT